MARPSKQSLLCRLGWHQWRLLGWIGKAHPAQLQRCQRCRHGRAVSAAGDLLTHYDPDQVSMMLMKYQIMHPNYRRGVP